MMFAFKDPNETIKNENVICHLDILKDTEESLINVKYWHIFKNFLKKLFKKIATNSATEYFTLA